MHQPRIKLLSILWKGTISTTRPLVHVPLGISITYSYFGHAVLPKPLTYSFTLRFKKKSSIVLLVKSINLMIYWNKPKFEHYALIIIISKLHSITRPVVHLPVDISITYSYYGHAVLPKPLTFSLTSWFRRKKKSWLVLLVKSINLNEVWK